MSVTAGCYDIELPCAPGELGILRACNEILTEQPVEFCAAGALLAENSRAKARFAGAKFARILRARKTIRGASSKVWYPHTIDCTRRLAESVVPGPVTSPEV